MIERYTYNKITWLDVTSPTQEEVHALIAECDIPREFANDLSTMSPRTEVFSKKGFLKITLDFPIVKRTDISHPHEVKFLITKSHFITIRFEDMAVMHRFSKEFEVLSMLKGKKPDTEGLFLKLLALFYDGLYEKLDYVDSQLKDIEEEIFEGHEEEMVYSLSRISRRLIAFKQVIDAHEEALDKLSFGMKDAFARAHTSTVDAIIHQYDIVRRRLQALTSTFVDLRETNNSLHDTKQNEFMRVFTILAFITFPLTLFSSMFGMNTSNTPIVGHPFDFWIIVIIMIMVSISFFAYFRHKKWF
jgi:magnesium transporter